MRGDLTIQKIEALQGLINSNRFAVEGALIAADPDGVAKRDSEKSFRVSLNAAAVKAVAPGVAAGEKIAVRFKMLFARTEGGSRLYEMVPAGDKPPHGMISVRA